MAEKKNHGGTTFKPGQSGNPAGRPKGARNRTTLAIEALLDDEAEALTRKAIELALKGDMAAIRLCMDRIAPPRRDRPTPFELPPMGSANDAVQALSSIVKAVAEGDLTPGEAAELSKVVETYARTLETRDFEKRLAQLEAKRMRAAA